MKKFIFITLLFFLYMIEASNHVENKEVRQTNMIKNITEQKRLEYVNFVYKTIEFKAEVKIPSNVDVNHVLFMYETVIKFDLPIRESFRMIRQESLFDSLALSPMNAFGYTQLMPNTYKEYHKKIFGDEFIDDHNPYKNIYIGLYYLRELYDYWNNFAKNEEYIWTLAFASYNAGKGRVIEYGGVPPFRETRGYVAYIMKEHSQSVLYASILNN